MTHFIDKFKYNKIIDNLDASKIQKKDNSIEQLSKIPVNHNDICNHLIENKYIKFCSINNVEWIFNEIKKIDHEVILFTGHDDTVVDEILVNRMPENIKFWYAQNANIINEKIRPLPIGIQSYVNCPIDGFRAYRVALHKLVIMLNHWLNKYEYEKETLISYSLREGTNPTLRLPVRKICENIDYCSIKCNLHFSEFYENILKSRSVICTRGHGIDTHRLWETLILGSVPIIIGDTINIKMFSDYPIAIIDTWEELYDKNHIIKKIEEQECNFIKFDRYKLTCMYQIDKLNNSIESIHENN